MNRTMRDKGSDTIIRILVADDTRLHTQLLADALRRDGLLEVISSDAQELTERTDLHNIDVLLLSADLNETGGGFAVLRLIYASHPELRAVILLDSSKSEAVLEAFRAGARGVLSRQDSIETLSKCIRKVHQGQIWANSNEMGLVVEALAGSRPPASENIQINIGQLSKREIDVVRCVAQGLTNREIAKNLGLSEHTIKNYLFKVYDKLGVSSRVELLFMTLSRSEADEVNTGGFSQNGVNQDLQSASILAGYQRAAEQGVPTAQLELARYYWTRKTDAKDLMQAYKWYLIAGHQISRTSKAIGKALTMEQLLQAEQMAADWLKRLSPPPPREFNGRAGNVGLRLSSK